MWAFLYQALTLKQTPRIGWVQRGVVQAESVAAHSYGVALIALALADSRPEWVWDRPKLLTLALLHDLPEAITSDLPAPIKQFLPRIDGESAKTIAERAALAVLTEGLSFGREWQKAWEELVTNQSAEAQLIHDADKLDLYLQAYRYEQETGNQRLDEFWRTKPTFHYPFCQELYEALYTTLETKCTLKKN